MASGFLHKVPAHTINALGYFQDDAKSIRASTERKLFNCSLPKLYSFPGWIEPEKKNRD